MIAEDLVEDARARLAGRDLHGLAVLVGPLHPADLADLLRHLDLADQATTLLLLPEDVAAAVIPLLSDEEQAALAHALSDEQLLPLLEEMPADEATDLLGDLPQTRARRLLSLMRHEDAAAVATLLRFPDRSAGGLMTTEYLAVDPRMTVQQTIEAVRMRGRDIEFLYYLYVIDAGRLVGIVTLRDLIANPPARPVGEVMRTRFVSVRADEDQETVGALARQYGLAAVPVLDAKGGVMGIITADDLLAVVKSEGTEDVLRLSGAVAGAEARTRGFPWGLAVRRAGFLVFNLGLNLIAALLISRFTATLQSTLALAFFLPALTATAGNVGTQSLALAVRGLATGRLSADRWSQASREWRTGGIVGAVAGAILGAFAALWQRDLVLGVIVGGAMWLALTVAAPIGMLIPFGLRRLRVDPAIASGPLTTTVTDNTTLLIYFLLATLLLRVVLP